jgi:hypothetical protein
MTVPSIQKDISEIKEILARQEEVLKDHIRRTELLEVMVLPIQRRVYMLEGVMYFLSSVGVGSLIIYLLSKVWH